MRNFIRCVFFSLLRRRSLVHSSHAESIQNTNQFINVAPLLYRDGGRRDISIWAEFYVNELVKIWHQKKRAISHIVRLLYICILGDRVIVFVCLWWCMAHTHIRLTKIIFHATFQFVSLSSLQNALLFSSLLSCCCFRFLLFRRLFASSFWLLLYGFGDVCNTHWNYSDDRRLFTTGRGRCRRCCCSIFAGHSFRFILYCLYGKHEWK